MRLLAASVILISALAMPAAAACGDPMWNGTASSTVPLRGSLYVYNASLRPSYFQPIRLHVEDWVSLAESPDPAARLEALEQERTIESLREDARLHTFARWRDTPGTIEQDLIAPGVIRIDYAGVEGSRLVVNEIEYQLSEDWRLPARAPRASMLSREQYAWSCSQHDALHIDIDQPTAAIRARWTSGGATREWVMPTANEHGRSLLMLGEIDCAGMTLDPNELDEGGRLTLHAIRLDGTEVPIAGLPAWISSSMIPTNGSMDELTAEDATSTVSSPQLALAIACLVLVLALARPRAPATLSS